MNDYFYVGLSRVTNHVPASTWDNKGVSTGETIFMFANLCTKLILNISIVCLI